MVDLGLGLPSHSIQPTHQSSLQLTFTLFQNLKQTDLGVSSLIKFEFQGEPVHTATSKLDPIAKDGLTRFIDLGRS